MLKNFKIKEKKRKNLRTNLGKIYTIMAAIILIGFGFFYSTKFFIADENDILNTEIGVEFAIKNTSKFTINEWIFDPETNRMQVTLITSNLTDYLSDLSFVSVSKNNLSKPLPTKIVYSSNDIYIVMIEDVPKNFNQVALRLVKTEVDFDTILSFDSTNIETNDDKTSEVVLVSIYSDERVVKEGEVKQQKVKEYAFQVTNELIADAEVNREKLMTEIQKNTLIISRIKEEIEKLKQELIYQTTAEQDETNNKIFDLEKEIENTDKLNSQILTDVDAFDSKIERLIQRKRDLQF